ncbi:MAG TPA: HEAT repeat domain-containing protein [Gemmatimonadales bacterium]|nr:HEAT repeat domain-containing protein [Gemmatimonadales bacterium]
MLLVLTALAALLLATLLVFNWWHRRRDERLARLSLDDLTHAESRLELVACLEALPGLHATEAARVRDMLCLSPAARRELAGLRHGSASRRAEACRFVGRLGDTAVVPRLVELLCDQDPAVRREAIRALGELRAVEAVPDIADAIEGLKEWSNLVLLMALIRMGPACAPAIGALLAEHGARSPAMLKGLLQVTSRIGVATDPAMIRALASHEDMEIRVEAVRVLGAIEPDPRSGDVCLAAMDDAEWPVRAIAASSLGRLRDERALARLRGAMGDPAYWVRHHVAEAMASMGEAGSESLRDALHAANPFVRDMAAQALFMRALAEGEAA